MASLATKALSRSAFATWCFASTLLVMAGLARAQEPAPATAPPPPPSWGGAAPAAEPAPQQSSGLSGDTSYSTTTTTTTTTSTTTPATEQPGGIKDSSPQSRPMMISAFTGLHYGHFSGYGFPMLIGGRFSIPIVPDGFIPSLNDEFGLEFGMDFDITFLSSAYNDSVLFGFGIPADAMWDFHITPKFDAYAKIGVVIGSVFNSGYGFWWTFRSAVGLRLKLNDVMYFRAEVGYPAIMAGLGFAL
jgi:hypothetical protein